MLKEPASGTSQLSVRLTAQEPGRPRYQRPAHHAILFTPRPPASPTRLLSVSESPHDIRLAAHCIAYSEDSQLALLEVQPVGFLPVPTPVELEVVRGRRGSKGPEVLQVLQPVHLRSEDMRSPQRTGFGRSVLRTIDTLCPEQQVSLPLAWLAVELSARGYCARTDLARTCRRIGHPIPDMPPGTMQCPGFIILAEWADRQAAAIDKAAARAVARNPFFVRLDTYHVSEWCGNCEAAVANVVLQRFAFARHTTVRPDPLGEAVDLACFGPQLTEQQAETVTAIKQRYVRGYGLKRSALLHEYPGYENLIAWLFEAHELAETAGGFVLARESLEAAFQTLGSRLGGLELPSTGLIKAVMNWNRQLAEGYRSFLESGLRRPMPRGGQLQDTRQSLQSARRSSKALRRTYGK